MAFTIQPKYIPGILAAIVGMVFVAQLMLFQLQLLRRIRPFKAMAKEMRRVGIDIDAIWFAGPIPSPSQSLIRYAKHFQPGLLKLEGGMLTIFADDGGSPTISSTIDGQTIIYCQVGGKLLLPDAASPCAITFPMPINATFSPKAMRWVSRLRRAGAHIEKKS
jgi:hypothetical protein